MQVSDGYKFGETSGYVAGKPWFIESGRIFDSFNNAPRTNEDLVIHAPCSGILEVHDRNANLRGPVVT